MQQEFFDKDSGEEETLHDLTDLSELESAVDERIQALGRLGLYFESSEYLDLTPERIEQLHRRQLLLERFERAYADIHSTSLRAHQIDGVSGLYDFLFLPNESDLDNGLTKRGVLTHAPGAGKSIFAAEVSAMFGVGQPPADEMPIVRALYLTHDRKGLGQTMGNEEVLRGFAKVCPDIERVLVQKGRSFEGVPIVGMTYSALRYWFKRNPAVFDDFDVLFGDECQEAMGPQTFNALKHIMRGKINIGLTGSPELSQDRNVFSIWPERIHDISFREGVEERGILNSFVLYRFDTGELLKSVAKDRELVPGSYKHLAKNEYLNEHTKRLALLFASHNIKTTIFAFRGGGSKHAIDLAAIFNDSVIFDRSTQLPRPARARAIGQFQAQSINNKTFAAFDRGEIDIITTTHMGETAWDPKQLNAIILLCPTRSLRAVIQRLGRGARISNQPTIVIHYDYGDAEQKSPYDVFDTPNEQGVVIRPKKSYRKKIGDNHGASSEKVDDQSPSELDQELVDDILHSSIKQLLAQASVRAWRRNSVRRGSQDIRDQGFEPLEPIAREYGIDQIILNGLLRRNRVRVLSLEQHDEVVSYGPGEKVRTFIEEQVARPQTYNAAQMIAGLGMSRKWIYNRLENDVGERRYPRDSLEVRKRTHYPQAVYDRLLAERDANALEANAEEISAVELCRKYGTDITRTSEWFARRGVAPIKRKQAKNTPGRGTVHYYPQKYEAQFAWHWSAEYLPKDKHMVPLAAVFERSPRLRKMGHEQRSELLKTCGIVPQRFRTKTNFNYFITKAEQVHVTQLANRTEIHENHEDVKPSASASRIARIRDEELFTQYVKQNKLEMPDEILAPTNVKPPAKTTEKSEPAVIPTASKKSVAAPTGNEKAAEDIGDESITQRQDSSVSSEWDEAEGLITAIGVASLLDDYPISSTTVANKANEYGIPTLKRAKNGQTFVCLRKDDVEAFVKKYTEDTPLSSSGTIAAVLQVPQNFVIDVAADRAFDGHEDDDDYLEQSIDHTKTLTPAGWLAVHRRILAALRSLGIKRPQAGRLLNGEALDRIRARIIMLDEPELNTAVANAAAWDILIARKEAAKQRAAKKK